MHKLSLHIVFTIFFSVFVFSNARAVEIAGTFVGIDQADGMAIWIEQDPADASQFTGRILGRDRFVYDFAGERAGDTLQGQATAGNPAAYLVLTYKSVGLVMNWVPIITPASEDAPAVTGKALSYVFVREGTFLPAMPSYFAPPPTPGSKFMSTLSFLDSYQFWPPPAVAQGFALIPANHRALLRFYPLVQTDILWKLCMAGGLSPQRQSAMKGQGVTCANLTGAIAAMQEFGTFNRYKRDVAAEKDDFRKSVGCGQGMLQIEICTENARGAAQRALEVRNVRAVINSYLQ